MKIKDKIIEKDNPNANRSQTISYSNKNQLKEMTKYQIVGQAGEITLQLNYQIISSKILCLEK